MLKELLPILRFVSGIASACRELLRWPDATVRVATDSHAVNPLSMWLSLAQDQLLIQGLAG